MKKLFITIMIISTFLSLILISSTSKKNTFTDNTTINDKYNKDKTSVIVNDKNFTSNNTVNEGIIICLDDNKYLMKIDKDKPDVKLNKIENNTRISEYEYVSIDSEKVLPIIDSIKKRSTDKEFTIVDYINIYDEIKPYIETNIPLSKLIGLAKDFKSISP